MEVIKCYKTKDGRLFYNSKDCEEYEEVCLKIDKIMKDLNPLPKDDSCRFANGGDYIKQEKEIVDKARIEITELGNIFFKQKDKWSFNAIGRLFNDSGHNYFYSAWGRLSNIDVYYREWGQSYYAAYPKEGIQEPFKEKK